MAEQQAIPKPKPKQMTGVQLVRILRRDLIGTKKVEVGLTGIRGVSYMLSHAVRIHSGVDKDTLLQDLTDDEIKKIEHVIENPTSYNLPEWLMNRRNDPVTGESTHIVESDLVIKLREDLTGMKKLKSYKGIRHINDLRVRGQRTKSTGRKNKTIGVSKKR